MVFKWTINLSPFFLTMAIGAIYFKMSNFLHHFRHMS